MVENRNGLVPNVKGLPGMDAVALLENLGIRSELLNLHMGWTAQSTMRHVYRRPILLLQVDSTDSGLILHILQNYHS